jgi:hypothetical protein
MKIFKNLAELSAGAPPAVVASMMKGYGDYPSPEDASLSFSDYFGGDVYLVESEEDLKEIPVYFGNEDDPEKENLFFMPGGFDICEWSDKSKKFVLLVLLCTNAGGPTWFVPEEFATDNVLQSFVEH